MTDANSRVLIVGGNSGMGLAVAKRCLDNGAEVIIVGRNEGKLNRARESLHSHSRLETIATDITMEDQVAALFGQVGQLSHIVCTAADIQVLTYCCPRSILGRPSGRWKARFSAHSFWQSMERQTLCLLDPLR